MITPRKNSLNSSEMGIDSDNVDFKVIHIDKNKNNNLENKDEDKKQNQLILISEPEKPLDKEIVSTKIKEREENIKGGINVPTKKSLIDSIEFQKGEIVNSSNEIINKDNQIIHKNNSKIFSYMRKYRTNGDNSSNKARSYDDNDINCLVCDKKLTQEQKKDNLIKCNHMACNECYYEFLKEKINSNFIEGIKCLEKDCDAKLYDNFIQKKLFGDIPLLEKYIKLDKKRQLMLNPNIQLCPSPDCDSYALKNGKNKYVSCIKYRHKFCFNCLKAWHGDKECDNSLDNSFKKWRDSNTVRRCPKCKYFIEKDEGCNHITCYNCRYQFCWLCMAEYTSGHYDLGRCSGLQFTDCKICSNRIINFLYQLLMSTLKCLLFAIVVPFLFVFFLGYAFSEKLAESDCINILNGIIGCFSFLNYIMCLIPMTSFIAILMFFYWPLQDKIFGLPDKF